MLGELLYERFVDVKISQLVITSESGKPVRVQLTLMGLTPQSIDSATFTTQAMAVALPSGDVLMHYDGAGAFLVEGVAVSSTERVVVTINNNDSRQPGDSLAGNDVTEGMGAHQIETTQRIDDVALYNRFHYGANPAVGAGPNPNPLELTGGIDVLWTLTPAAPGPERSLRIVAPRLQISALEGYEPGTGNDPIKRATTYKVYRPASGSGMTATVKNGSAT